MPEQDYLVIYEEEDPGDGAVVDDHIVLDIDRIRRRFRAEVDVETDIDIDLQNTSSRLGLVGVLVSTLGAILGLAAVAIFATSYPDDWFDPAHRPVDTAAQDLSAFFGVFGALCLLAGTFLTAFGRRISARGILQGVHIVEKEPREQARLE